MLVHKIWILIIQGAIFFLKKKKRKEEINIITLSQKLDSFDHPMKIPHLEEAFISEKKRRTSLFSAWKWISLIALSNINWQKVYTPF